MSIAQALASHVYSQRNLRFHPAYETPRDKQRAQRDTHLPDNSRLRALNERLRKARILPALA